MTHSDAVIESLKAVEALQDEIRSVGLTMLEADGGALYTIDIVAIAALNRALALIAGFGLLAERRNFLSAAVLLRVQLDNALRFSAIWRVTDSDAVAHQMISGTAVRQIKDRDGVLMTDSRLLALFEGEQDWVPEVYERSSGYVHLSEAHVAHAMSGAPNADGSVPFKIAAEDEWLDDPIYHEAIAAFHAATDLFVELIEKWTVSKIERAGIAKNASSVGHANDPAAIILRGAP